MSTSEMLNAIVTKQDDARFISVLTNGRHQWRIGRGRRRWRRGGSQEEDNYVTNVPAAQLYSFCRLKIDFSLQGSFAPLQTRGSVSLSAHYTAVMLCQHLFPLLALQFSGGKTDTFFQAFFSIILFLIVNSSENCCITCT